MRNLEKTIELQDRRIAALLKIIEEKDQEIAKLKKGEKKGLYAYGASGRKVKVSIPTD